MPSSLHSPAYASFVARFKQARKERGLTQVEVCERLEIPRTRLSNMESGQRRVDVVELARFAKLYRKPLGWFVR